MQPLITDRTEEDVINETAKGSYGASDLNRVGLAVRELTSLLVGQGVAVVTAPKTDWSESDIPRESDAERYLGNVVALRDAVGAGDRARPLPVSMQCLTYEGANAIEATLEVVFARIENMLSGQIYCGEFICGEV